MALDFTTDINRVRLLIGDTNESSFMFETTEITALLALNDSSVYGAAADACRSIASTAARSAIAYKILADEFQVDKKKIPEYYLKLAETYDAKREVNDDTDYSVDWRLLVTRIDGRDESDYEDTTDEDYLQDHNWEGGL